MLPVLHLCVNKTKTQHMNYMSVKNTEAKKDVVTKISLYVAIMAIVLTAINI